MTSTGSMGDLLLAALLKEPSDLFIRRGDIGHMLVGTEREAYKLLRHHVTQYGVLPDPSTVTHVLKVMLPADPPEPADFYMDLVTKRYVENEISTAVERANLKLKVVNGLPDPMEAYRILKERLISLNIDMRKDDILDLRKAYDTVVPRVMALRAGTAPEGLGLGWPTLDNMSAGLFPGDVISFVGRPQKGKTWMMLWAALHNWSRGKVPLFVSMEMDLQLVLTRLVGLLTGIESKKLMKGDVSDKEEEWLKQGLVNAGNAPHPFWIVDGNLTSTVSDIQSFTQQMKPDIVFIDGAYLLSHEDKKMNKFQRVDANCEAMKRELAARCKIPVVASFQFNRVAATKISKNEEKKTDVELQVGLEDIAHSDAIGQISSIVLGFFEEQTPENINVKRVDILKGRGGEQGVFKCRWDFQKMDFSEILPSDTPEEGTFDDEKMEHVT